MKRRGRFVKRRRIATLHEVRGRTMIEGAIGLWTRPLTDPLLMANFVDYRERRRFEAVKPAKGTLFQTERLLLGLNCLEPGQAQEVHTHADQDKFYFVLEGEGEFNVGGEVEVRGPGCAIWAPAGVEHGMLASGGQRLVVLVGIAPAPHA